MRTDPNDDRDHAWQETDVDFCAGSRYIERTLGVLIVKGNLLISNWLAQVVNAGRWLAISLLACCHLSMASANAQVAHLVSNTTSTALAATANQHESHALGASQHENHAADSQTASNGVDADMSCCPDDGDGCSFRLDKVSAKLQQAESSVTWLPWLDVVPLPEKEDPTLSWRSSVGFNFPFAHAADEPHCRTHLKNCTFLD